MGEAKRRKERDSNFGKVSKVKQNFDHYQKDMSRSQLADLNGFLGMTLGQLLTRASNLVGDVEASDSDAEEKIRKMQSYQELKEKTEELVDFVERDQKPE